MSGATKFFCLMDLNLVSSFKHIFINFLSSVVSFTSSVFFFFQFRFTGWKLSRVVSGLEVTTSFFLFNIRPLKNFLNLFQPWT